MELLDVHRGRDVGLRPREDREAGRAALQRGRLRVGAREVGPQRVARSVEEERILVGLEAARRGHEQAERVRLDELVQDGGVLRFGVFQVVHVVLAPSFDGHNNDGGILRRT